MAAHSLREKEEPGLGKEIFIERKKLGKEGPSAHEMTGEPVLGRLECSKRAWLVFSAVQGGKQS